MSIVRCPKCNGPMERGFNLVDKDGHVVQARWMEGIASVSRWWGVRDLKKRRKYFIVADRCIKCGFMEQYATEEAR